MIHFLAYDSRFIDGVSIGKTLTINAVNCTISGSNLARIFTIAGNVVLNNITMINGTTQNSAFRGGAITHTGGSLEINDCIFENCKAVSDTTYYPGGALYSNGNGLTIRRSKFNNNIASGGGAIIYNPTDTTGSSLVIIDSNFTNNVATSSDGGAIYTMIGSLDIDGCNFVNNTARSGHGGALFTVVYNANKANIVNSNFEKNTAASGKYGGAIYVYDGSGQGGYKFDNCSFISNKAGVTGGAIFTRYAFTVTNSKFIDNSANYGGAIYGSLNDFNVYSSIFLNNHANAYASTIHTSDNSPEIKDNIFLNNTGGSCLIYHSGTGTLNADYNWFGNNASNKNTKLPTTAGTVTLDRWLYLDADTNVTGYDIVFKNETVLMNFNLNQWAGSSASSGGDYVASNLPAFNLTLSTVNGRVNTTFVNVTGGISDNFLFTSGENYGDSKVIGDYIGLARGTYTLNLVPDVFLI